MTTKTFKLAGWLLIVTGIFLVGSGQQALYGLCPIGCYFLVIPKLLGG